MNLWYPGARRWAGNPAVTGYSDDYAHSVGYNGTGKRGPKRGSVNHSAEGTNQDVIHDLLLIKSWHFTIYYDFVEQHHEIDVNCWHAGDTDDDGGVRANFELVGKEHIGVAGQSLTPYQIVESVNIDLWLAQQFGRSAFRRFDGWEPDEAGVWVEAEHNEVSNTYTACPSKRIPWGLIMLGLNPPTQEDEMKLFLGQFAEKIPWQTSYKAFVDSAGVTKKSPVKSAAEYELLKVCGYDTKAFAKIKEIPDA